MSVQCAAAEMITVPGDNTSPSGYFCFIESESLPVGMLMPSAIANSEQASTASYNLASSPGFLQGHIQFADRDTPEIPFLTGAHTILVSASAIEFRLPASAFASAETGECPIDVATPSTPLKSSAITPTLFSGS